MNINTFLNQIENNEIVLPAIQREFVWKKDKITMLLDSIMRGYPIGLALLWETFDNIQYRNFEDTYKPRTLHTFYDNDENRKLKMVLDGQQRLQSLYIAFRGIYGKEYLYFDILSGIDNDDFQEEKFIFDFLKPKVADEWNSETISELKEDREKDKETKWNEIYYYVRVADIVDLGPKEKEKLKEDLKEKLGLESDQKTLVATNIELMYHSLYSNENLLKGLVLDENKSPSSPDRKTESDVLETFVRFNTKGTPLSRSDLIFSMLKLNWKESATSLPEFIDEVNKNNSFDIDTDFVIRCLLAVSDLGTKFNINLLRTKSNIKKMQNNFDSCCDAISSTLDFIQGECNCSSSKVLGNYFNYVPLVYYLFHTKNHLVPNSQINNVKKSLFLFSFSGPFSRYADSRIWRFIEDELKPLAENGDETFPYQRAIRKVNLWEGIENCDEDLISGNINLALHMVQGKSGAKVKYEKNAPQIDHIFPRSILRKKDFEEDKVNHFANFWILGKNKNQNKSNIHPKKYFADVPDSVLKNAFIERDFLNYGRYTTFLKKRKKKILNRVNNKVGFKESDFDFLKEEDEE